MYANSQGVGCCGPSPSSGLGWFAQAMQVATLAAGVFSSKSGGDSASAQCWDRYDNRAMTEPCPDTPNYDAVVRAVARGPDFDITKIISKLLLHHGGNGPKNRAQLSRLECVPFWVKALLGGKDCVSTQDPGFPIWFMNFVETYGAPLTAEEAEPGSSWLPDTPGIVGGAGTILPIVAAGVALFFLPKLLK